MRISFRPDMKKQNSNLADNPWLPGTQRAKWVSVIIPTRNNADVIIETLDSVVGQRYRPIELIIIDDGSTDDTSSRIDSWRVRLNDDPRLDVIYCFQENQGGSVARNVGLKKSTGEFIQFLDADDLIAPGKIENQVKHFNNGSGSCVIYGPWRYFKRRPRRIQIFRTNRTINEAENLLLKWIGGWFVPCHSFLWQRLDIQSLGKWDETLHADQDGEYILRFMLNGGQLRYCETAWSYYRINDSTRDTVSKNQRIDPVQSRIRLARDIERRLEESDQLDDAFKKALAFRYYEIAKFWAFKNLEIHDLCMQNYYRLAPDSAFPGSARYRIIKRILGDVAAQKLRFFVTNNFRFLGEKPVGTLNSIEELLNHDE